MENERRKTKEPTEKNRTREWRLKERYSRKEETVEQQIKGETDARGRKRFEISKEVEREDVMRQGNLRQRKSPTGEKVVLREKKQRARNKEAKKKKKSRDRKTV